jgi:hypothetical protein
MVILATVNAGTAVQVADNVLSDMNITEQAITEALDRLITDGYLDRRSERDAPGRRTIGVTRRARTAYGTILSATIVKRWVDLPFRQGDIIVSSVPKSGTTWVQMICALLIFQTPDLSAPLQELSPWPGDTVMRDDIFARLAAQRHRRFMKSHELLGAIPADPRVTYIVVARHPLDAALSFHNQRHFDKPGQVDRSPAREEPSPQQTLLQWMNMESHPAGAPFHHSLPGVMEMLCAAWERRDEPNVVLVRYEDLSADLEGQMRGLAARLGISVPEETWPGLVKAATFEQMRGAASRIQPMADLADPKKFFHNGRAGAGRELLTDTGLARYQERTERLAPPDMLAWLHAPGGSAVSDRSKG